MNITTFMNQRMNEGKLTMYDNMKLSDYTEMESLLSHSKEELEMIRVMKDL